MPGLTGTSLFEVSSRSVLRFAASYLVLRTFGHCAKVAIELALMAADAGLARTDEAVISGGGSGKGVDTALVLRPANSADFLELVAKEVMASRPGFNEQSMPTALSRPASLLRMAVHDSLPGLCDTHRICFSWQDLDPTKRFQEVFLVAKSPPEPALRGLPPCLTGGVNEGFADQRGNIGSSGPGRAG